MDIAKSIVDKLTPVDTDKGEDPGVTHATAMLSAIRTGNAEGLDRALRDHYQHVTNEIDASGSQESAGDEANTISTE